MSAIVLTAPSKWQLQARTHRECDKGEALIRIIAVGVCATDVELFEGTMGYFEAGLARWPFVPGHEWAGEVVGLGEDVPPILSLGMRVIGEHATGCKDLLPPDGSAGDIVQSGGAQNNKGLVVRGFMTSSFRNECRACAVKGGFLGCPRRAETGFFRRDGGFQTHMYFPARQLHVLPDTVPWDLAVLAEPLCTACKAVRLAGISDIVPKGTGPRVAVIGDGPVGLLVVQVLLWKGAQVACVLGADESRLARAQELGVQAVWNVTQNDEARLAQTLQEEGDLPAIAIEAAGHPSAVPLAIRSVAPRGRVVLLGLSGNRISDVRADDIVLKQLSVIGSLSSEPEDWAEAAAMLSSGLVNTIVTHKLDGLDTYYEAIKHVKTPLPGMLKVAVFPNGIDKDIESTPSKKVRTLL